MSRPSPVGPYTPALGSHAAIAVAHLKSAHPAKVSGTELAELLKIDSKNVFACLRRAEAYGVVKLEKAGNRNIYSLTELGAINSEQPAEVSNEQLQSYAKRAVIMLRGETRSSVDLAAWCNTTAEVIDRALATLAADKRLLRVDVIRGGQTMFDYRWGATYVPHDADFDQHVPGSTPVPTVSAVADPQAKVGNPGSPWRNPGSLRLPGTPDFKPRDALAAGTELGKKEPVAPTQKASEQKLEQAKPQAFQPEVPQFQTVDAETMLGWKTQIVDEPEPEFGINSRGELTILTISGDVELEARHALALKRFLGNTSILEELAAGGAL